MERRTQVLLGLGFLLVLAVAGALTVALVPSGPTLSATWVSDPPEGAGSNHHGLAVGAVDGQMLILAPISAPSTGPACQLMALDADSGESVWRHQVPPDACTIHAVADPTITEWNGRLTVLVTTTENALFDLDPHTGEVRSRYDLPAYGYTAPVVADLSTQAGEEVLVVDARGTIQVIGADGRVVWGESLDSFVWARPVVGDLTGDGGSEVAIGTSDGRLLILAGDGSLIRDTQVPSEDAITWLTSGQLDDDPAIEVVGATTGGDVFVVDAATGEIGWSRTFARFAAVQAIGDGDGDGTHEVYATANDGVARASAGDTGETLWEREVATADVQMMPPPVIGDVTGDGSEELVVASNDGRVVALDPGSGTLIAEFDRDGRIFSPPVLADVDGDREHEIFVIYAAGDVVRLDYEE